WEGRAFVKRAENTGANAKCKMQSEEREEESLTPAFAGLSF
ncbi:MAG: hypothetical protein JWL69_4860, partial [Phycisphaerales bacterium]|nr:hypothetical protein [Phycisphaerales bacterium]